MKQNPCWGGLGFGLSLFEDTVSVSTADFSADWDDISSNPNSFIMNGCASEESLDSVSSGSCSFFIDLSIRVEN